MTHRCFACNRPLKSKHLVSCSDEQTVYVGPECFKKIKVSGEDGWQPPLGGPKLYQIPTPSKGGLGQKENKMTNENWFIGSNGNCFLDAQGSRYCVAMNRDKTFEVARNGRPINGSSFDIFNNLEDAKAFVDRFVRPA